MTVRGRDGDHSIDHDSAHRKGITALNSSNRVHQAESRQAPSVRHDQAQYDPTTQTTGASQAGDAPRPPRTGKELLDATRPFAVESAWESWWSVCSTLAILVSVLVIAAIAPWWPLRLVASVLGGLVFLRTFILYHDFMHHALLRRSHAARPLFFVLGSLMLSPPRYWRHSHNFHHGHVGKPLEVDGHPEEVLLTSDVGSFPLMTTEKWRTTTWWQRVQYRVTRHPLTLLAAYATVFLYSLTILPLIRSPRRYWDGALSVLAHGATLAAIWVFAGFGTLFFAFLLPFAIAAAIGAYLFYAQHNYEGMHVLDPNEWTFYRGATESSSYMRLNAIMDWFTGNIGYHHIHHINSLIPFYRLREVMRAIPELQTAKMTSLRPSEIRSCLRLNLWDPEKECLVPYRAAQPAA